MHGPKDAKFAAAKAFCAFNLASFTIGAEASHVINVAVQLKDALARALAQIGHLRFYLSDSSDGHTLTATATTSALAIGTNGVLQNIEVTGKVGVVMTDTSGRFDINITQTAAKTYYLVLQMPDGSIVVSGAIVHAG